jgi:hypothetical protein
VVVWWCKLSGGRPDESSTRSSPYVIAGAMPHIMGTAQDSPTSVSLFAEHDTVNQLVYTVGWMNAKGLQCPQSSSRTANKSPVVAVGGGVCLVWFGLVWFGLVRGNGHTVARRFGLDVAQKIFRLVQLGRNRAAEPNASENEHVVCPFLRRREQDRRVRSRMSEWKWLHWSESHDPWNVGHGSFLAAGDPPVPPNSRSAQCDFGASQRIQGTIYLKSQRFDYPQEMHGCMDPWSLGFWILTLRAAAESRRIRLSCGIS